MAAMVARGSQLSPSISIQEKGNRNKRKFRADLPLVSFADCDSASNNNICDPKIDGPNYEFSTEKTQSNNSCVEQQHGLCDLCSFNQEQHDLFKASIRSGSRGSDLGHEEFLQLSQPREEPEIEEFQDADWNNLTEAQLEELVLSNLDAIFRSAIKKIASCGYSEEVAMKAVLRPGICYGCKDTVSNIVDNTLAYLRNGQEMNSKDQLFGDLHQLEKSILKEMVCVLREVRPFFSTGDAMWCLLICDMNVSHACAMDGDPLSNFGNDEVVENSSASTSSYSKSESKCSNLPLPESDIPKLDKPSSGSPCHQSSQPEMPTVTGIPNLPLGRFSLSGNKGKILALEGKLQQTSNSCCSSTTANLKCGTSSTDTSVSSSKNNLEELSSVLGEQHIPSISQSSRSEEKSIPNPNQPEAVKRTHMSSSKRESLLRQKSGQLEKIYRPNGVKGSSRMSKGNGFGGLMLDKKCRAVSDSGSSMQKNSSAFHQNKAIGIETSQADGHCQKNNFSINPGPAIKLGVNPKKVDSSSPSPALLANTELSLSLPSNNKVSPELNFDVSTSVEEALNFSYAGIPSDKIFENCCPDGAKDEMLLKLVPRVRELQSQLQEWTEWAQQKVMQAARRLSKDKVELKTLRQEKEEVARLKKEIQTLEENTMKKLSEMENALGKASGQVERANTAVRRLELENSELRQEMEAAKVQAAESAASCQEVSTREKKAEKKFQSWERQKALFQEELVTEKRKLSQLQQQVQQAKNFQAQLEARWKQEKKMKDEVLMQVNSERKEREQMETAAKSKEDSIRLKAESDFQKYTDDIKRIENEIANLRLKTDSSKMAALRWGMDSSNASCLTENPNVQVLKEINVRLYSEIADFQDSQLGDVQRERECVMCLTEEMSVVFLPCAHQVVCTKCNELHEKQGMKDCPSCRTPIMRRIYVRSADS